MKKSHKAVSLLIIMMLSDPILRTVGKDRLTFEVAPTIHGTGKLVMFEHLETHALPPNWQHLMK